MAERQKGDDDDQLTVDTNLEEPFNVGPRFTNVNPIGHGSTGLVLSALDAETNKTVAIKTVALQDKRGCQLALREIRILYRLKHENIVQLHDVLGVNGMKLSAGESNLNELKTVYLVQELLDADLNHLIHSGQLLPEHIKFLIYQTLRGLKYLHSANVLHRDLKPSNILVSCEDLTLKLADFGLSRVVDPNYDHDGHLSARVGTAWYRSPEMILTPSEYSTKTDQWSVGCILAEMLLGGKPLFSGGHDMEQLLQVVDAVELGDQDWSRVLRVMPNKLLKNHPLSPRKPLRERLKNADEQAIGLVEALMTFDPEKRVSAAEALKHPYLSDFYCANDDEAMEPPFCIEHEVDDLPIAVLRRQIIAEHAQCRPLTRAPPGSDPDAARDETPRGAPTEESHVPEAQPQGHTHTLEEIFKMPQTTPVTRHRYQGDVHGVVESDISGGSRGSRSQAGGSGVARNNLLNSRKNAQNSSSAQYYGSREAARSSPSIFDVRQEDAHWTAGSGDAEQEETEVVVTETAPGDIQAQGVKVKLKAEPAIDDEEKDVAEYSLSKLREDIELGIYNISQQLSSGPVQTHPVGEAPESRNTEKTVPGLSESSDQQPIEALEITISGDFENSKEYSQPSPKNTNQTVISTHVQQDQSRDTDSSQSDSEVLLASLRRAVGVGDIRGDLPDNAGRTARNDSDLNEEAGEIRRPRRRNRTNRGGRDANIKDEENEKQKLKAEKSTLCAISRKLILDKIESEKEREGAGAAGQEHVSLTAEELDELYRLPTEHLHKDSGEEEEDENERLKAENHLARLQRERRPRKSHDNRQQEHHRHNHHHHHHNNQHHHNHHHHHHHNVRHRAAGGTLSHQQQSAHARILRGHRGVNERLKENLIAGQGRTIAIEGACGGYDNASDQSDHSESDDVMLHNILGDPGSPLSPFSPPTTVGEPLPGGTPTARGLPTARRPATTAAITDPLSSPESPPTPPLAACGARPKKSPKKQRAL